MKKIITICILSLLPTLSYSSSAQIGFYGYVGTATCEYNTNQNDNRTFVNLRYSGSPTLTVSYSDKNDKIIQLEFQQSTTNQTINVGYNVTSVSCM